MSPQLSSRLLGPIAAVMLGLAAGPAYAAERAPLLKIATIAPKGSLYHRVLQDVGEAYRNALGGQGRAIVYPDSIQGTEPDTVRRMRIGQLDASMLTVIGLNEIDPAVTALQYMPMVFRNWEEVDYVRDGLRSTLEERLAAKGFIVLFWGEAGWVQFFTKERITLPEEYKRTRVFAWAGDVKQVDIMKSLGYTPVSVQVTDLLPGLESGMIETAPVAPMWALWGQIDRVTKYMLPINWVPIAGATVMRKQTFDALPPAAREAVLAASKKAGEQLRAHRAVQDNDCITAMQARGLTVLPLTPEVEAAWRKLAEQAWPRVRGSMVPADMFDRVHALLAEYRAGKK
ncbi:MAG TPA: TRAP transporter substrate-binding protein DctP [Burkholderiales bacterium]|nr:TRAP transporter substrate-binding protein DctP [Burkholderiales bacterium]